MVHLIVLDASVVTTLVAGCQWAGKLGVFGARSADWAIQNWRAPRGHHSGLGRFLGPLALHLGISLTLSM
jgi:hypothetical protein